MTETKNGTPISSKVPGSRRSGSPRGLLAGFEPALSVIGIPRRSVGVLAQLGIAILFAATGFLTTLALWPLLKPHAFLFFLGAVCLSAYYGGWLAGIACAVVSACIGDYFFVPPLYTFSFAFPSVVAAASFVLVALVISGLTERQRRAQRELKELARRLTEAEERERRAISRELHDEVGQSLGALLVEVDHLIEISNQEHAFGQGLREVKTLAENCVNEVRNMALLLRPSMLDDLGLVAALEWQAREVSRRTGMVVDLVEENVVDNLPDEHKTCVYRVVQEALNNCSKHAYAKNVRVGVRQEQSHLRVSIEDDGGGFDPSRMRGLGLLGMNERVSQLGGVLKVDSDPTRGTRLRIDLPLPGSSADRGELS